MSDLAGAPFWPTYISPANACHSCWQLMRLNSSEVQALQASAPEQLKARLGSGDGTLAVDELDLEFFFRRIRATVQGETGDVAAKLDMGFLPLNRQRLQLVSAVAAQPEALAPSAATLRQPLTGSVRADLRVTNGPPGPGSARQRFAADAILDKRLVIRKPIRSPPIVPVPDPPPQPGKSVLETPPDDIFELALICSVVPPSPNPDPGPNRA